MAPWAETDARPRALRLAFLASSGPGRRETALGSDMAGGSPAERGKVLEGAGRERGDVKARGGGRGAQAGAQAQWTAQAASLKAAACLRGNRPPLEDEGWGPWWLRLV